MRSWVLGLSFLLLCGCGSRRIAVRVSADDQFELAKNRFDSKKYSEAAESFKRVIFEHPGSDLVDDAQHYLAECYFLMGDYTQAREEYTFLLDNLPHSPYRAQAFFRLGVCYYRSSSPHQLNQSQTRKALEIFEDFATRFPDSELLPQAQEYKRSCLERLAEKQLEAGKHYLRMGKYSSAEIYLRDGIQSFPDSRHVKEFHLLLGECYEKQGETDKALLAYREVAQGNDEFANTARKRLEKMEEKR